ncbi:MAG: hypothetical protein ACTS3F_03975 [Phycisphaerales bacterium]
MPDQLQAPALTRDALNRKIDAAEARGINRSRCQAWANCQVITPDPPLPDPASPSTPAERPPQAWFVAPAIELRSAGITLLIDAALAADTIIRIGIMRPDGSIASMHQGIIKEQSQDEAQGWHRCAIEFLPRSRWIAA